MCTAGAAGMLQWGNVFFCVAKRTVDKAALAGQEITEEVVEAAEKDLKQAEAKYEESRRIKPNYYDAFISMGNVEFERAKLSLGFAVPPPQYVPIGFGYTTRCYSSPAKMACPKSWLCIAMMHCQAVAVPPPRHIALCCELMKEFPLS